MTDDITARGAGVLDGMSAYNERRLRLLQGAEHQAADDRLRARRLARRAAAWIVEKFRTWSDCDGDVERSFTKDQLLDNLMVYWVTATAHSSGRMYYEFDKGPQGGSIRSRSSTQPVGYARYPKEIMRTSARWAEAQYPLAHFADMPPRRPLRRVRVPRAVRARRADVLPSTPDGLTVPYDSTPT